ncbi:MAG: serine--tRNA ligase, partial [Alphaproteobacteria bacterium]|nr:serine--tRNA ligase [Alphaproteobacteria bacterium]
MHDIKFIREHADLFDAGLARRGLAPQAGYIQDIDERVRITQTTVESLLAHRNMISKQIGQEMAKGNVDAANSLKAEVEQTKRDLPLKEEAHRVAVDELRIALSSFPNRPADDVPDGADENDNVEQHRWGTPRNGGAEHFDIGAPLGLDFESAQSVAGARFAYLRQGVARLHRALGQFMLDHNTAPAFGYEEVNPPVLVRDEAMFGTAQ